MGKLTLLLVASAVIAGSLLTFSTRRLAGETQAGHRSAQADLLVRQIAESGHAVVLAAIVGDTGFQSPPISTRAYEGGTYRVEYDPSSTANRTTFTVTGDYRGARHTVRSTYDWDPMSYPSPVWLDVPYATSLAAAGTTIQDMMHFDRRKHDALALESLVPLGAMNTALGAVAATAGASYQAPAAGAWGGLLEDLNVDDGEGLYQTALAMTPETVIPGPVTITNNRTGVGAPDEVTHVTGDLTVNRRLEGEGVLVVSGALEVPSSGQLSWSGIVIVRAERQYLPVILDGRVSITGGLVVVQHAYPPGGHMDVTTWRDLTNGLSSGNVRGESPVSPWTTGFPWHQHKHRFDEDLGTRRVRFLEGGSAVPSQESFTRFANTINALGNQRVYLEFENENRHGYGVYNVNVDGATHTGLVRDGFGSFSGNGSAHRSQSFRASDLEDFEVDIRSLRTLEDLFDGTGCDSWPFCTGERWDRGGALRVRVRAQDNRILHESALYWHMQNDEWSVYQAQEAAWRTMIQNGGLFGTRLEMGPNVNVSYSVSPILALVERLGFDGNEVIHLGTETEHSTYDQNFGRSQLGNGEVRVCHKPAQSAQNKDLNPDAIADHLGHGDFFGNCDGTFPTATASPAPGPGGGGPGITIVCHDVGLPTQQELSLRAAVQVTRHLGHANDRLGPCP